MPPPAIDEAAARVQAGCPTGRTGAGIPGRFGIRTIRNARFPMKAPGGLQFRQRAEKRERRSKTNSPGIVLSVRRRTTPPGDRTGNAAGERAERPRVRLGLAEPGSEEGSCDRFLGCADRPFPAETPGEPGISAKPDYILCYTSHFRRCFRLILPDGWKPFGMEPAGKYLHLAHSVY